MIESFESNPDNRKNIIQEYIDKTSKDTEAVIGGCTHYPLIESEFKKISDLKTIDPADAIVSAICRRDVACNASTGNEPNLVLYTTAEKEKL
jgi:glutamate racemase